MEIQILDTIAAGAHAGADGGRFAAYIAELRGFFAERQMAFGSPEDLPVFAAALKEPGTFRDELASMTRSVVYREQGAISITELLELMAVAMGGAQIAEAGERVREPVRELLAFLGRAIKTGRGEAASPAAAVEQNQDCGDENQAPAMEQTTTSTVEARIHAAIDATVANDEHKPAGEDNFSPYAVSEFYSRARSITPSTDDAEFLVRSATIGPETIGQHLETSSEVSSLKQMAALPFIEDGNDLAMPRTGPIQWSRALGICAVTGLVAFTAILLLRWTRPDIGTVTSGDAATFAVGPAETAAVGGASRAYSASPRMIDRKKDSTATATATDGALRRDDISVGGPASAGGVNPDGSMTAIPPDASVLSGEARPGIGGELATADSGARSTMPTLSSRSIRSVPSRRPGVYTVSSGVMAGNLISAPTPDYPKLAGLFHMEGQVILQAVVSRNGRVVATHVMRGHRLLRGAAEDAVRRWRYRPYTVNGQATDVATIVTVNFRRR